MGDAASSGAAAGGRGVGFDHAPNATRPVVGAPDCSVAWCVGCGRAHGFGWCAHALRLTQRHLERRGVRFNWR